MPAPAQRVRGARPLVIDAGDGAIVGDKTPGRVEVQGPVVVSKGSLLMRAARLVATNQGSGYRVQALAAEGAFVQIGMDLEQPGTRMEAQAFIDLGFKLGFGGAVTYERALQLRRLAAELPLSALVLETDAPDIPPHWLYVTAEQRAAGQARQPNEPAELPRIGAVVAGLRGIAVEELALASARNAGEALPGVMEGIF